MAPPEGSREPDEETMKAELKDAFRLYDKEGNGYITTGQIREIFMEVDPNIKAEDLDDVIDEIDEDGTGNLDFEAFCKLMLS